jgi:hypothetical protein
MFWVAPILGAIAAGVVYPIVAAEPKHLGTEGFVHGHRRPA